MKENLLSFPKLDLGPFDLEPVAFRIGSLSFNWYGIIIAVGFLLAFWYLYRRAKVFGLDADKVFDVCFIAALFGIVGARLYYVIFSSESYDFARIFRIWEGGLAIYGGIIGGLIGAIIAAKFMKVRIRPLLDLGGICLLIGQGIGRWGNFVNIEAFGCNTDSIFGMISPKITQYLTDHMEVLTEQGMIVDPNAPVHPCFLYESFFCLLGFILLHSYTKHRKFDGEIFLMYAGYYGLVRFFIEGLRVDSLMLGSVKTSQLVAAISVIVSIVAIVAVRIIKKKTNSPKLVLYAQTEESKMILEAAQERIRAEKERAAQKREKRRNKGKDVSKEEETQPLSEDPAEQGEASGQRHAPASCESEEVSQQQSDCHEEAAASSPDASDPAVDEKTEG